MWQQVKSMVRRSNDWSRNRSALAALASMDDALLSDLGVHRGDIRPRFMGRDLAL